MSRNIEVLRQIYEAFNRRDLEALLAGFHADIEVEETEDLAYAAALLRVLGPRFVMLSSGYRGHEEVKRLFEAVWEISEWFYAEPGEFIEAEEQVIVVLMLRARAKETGLEGKAWTSHLWTMRDGKGARLRVYANQAQALKAAGIERER